VRRERGSTIGTCKSTFSNESAAVSITTDPLAAEWLMVVQEDDFFMGCSFGKRTAAGYWRG
jgi:hypothetical protein